MNTKNLLFRVVPATFVAGALFGVAVGTIGAAFKGSAVFRDVPAGHYADDAIGEMYQLGIIKGLDSAHFGPDDPITRGQVAVLLQRLRNEIKGITPVTSSSSRSSSSSSVSSSISSSVSSSYNPGGSIHFDANGYNIDKNASIGQVTILVARTGGNAGAGTVDYSFSGGTAVAGKNFQPQSGTLSFNNKETSKKLTLVIMNDTTTTGTKTVNLVLKNPTGVLTLSNPSTATLNINDPNNSSSSSSSNSSTSSVSTATTISLSATAYGVAKNGGNMTVTVNRSGVTTSAVGINYATVDGSAHSGTDYTATSGTFAFAAGETTKTFTIPVIGNNVIQGNRIFTVSLSNPTGGAGIGVASAPVTINDDQSIPLGSGSLKFSTATYSVSMSQGKAVITVSHVLGINPVSVHYVTTGGSAAAGIDYTSVSGTLTFATNETSKTFEIPVLNNSASTGGKTVNMSIDSPSGGVALLDPSSAVLTIDL